MKELKQATTSQVVSLDLSLYVIIMICFDQHHNIFLVKLLVSIEKKKRLYTRGTKKGIRISPLVKNSPHYHDWLRILNEEKDELFELHRREGRFERHSLHCTKCRAFCF